MAQFLGGGLRLDKDTDATECLLLLEVANDSAFPIFMWRPSTKVHRGEIVNEEGDLSGGGVTEVPGGSRRCLSLRIPRLQVGPEGKVTSGRSGGGRGEHVDVARMTSV